ncbi:hypothetical protein ACFL2H_00850, partial [Planctomycetota bacterium]
DTEENQREYPQAKTQKPGIGFPIARCVAIMSLATACVMDLAIGPYSRAERGHSIFAGTNCPPGKCCVPIVGPLKST